MKYLNEHFNYLISEGKYPGVDTLRFLAIISVVLFHTSIPNDFWPARLGWLGVDLFFVISGFLIGSIIIQKLKKRQFSFPEFYKNRSLRILPTYYFIIITTALIKVSMLKSDSSLMWESILSSVFFIQTTGPYFFNNPINYYYVPGGSWSLVVEEYFYLLAPLLLYFLFKIKKEYTPYILGILIMLAIPLNILITSHFHPNDYNWFFANSIQFHSRYVGLCLGVLAAYIISLIEIKNQLKRYRTFCIFISTVIIICCASYLKLHPQFLLTPQTLTWQTVILPSLIGSSFFFLLLASYNIKSLKWIVFLARLSFPLYLVHILFIDALNIYFTNSIPLPWAELSLVTLAICLPLSYIISLCIEYPFIRIYKKSTTSLNDR